MFAAILLCGTCLFTACGDDDDKGNTPEEQKENTQRQQFLNHTTSAIKDLAENLDFSGWEVCNAHAENIMKYVLSNKNVQDAFMGVIAQQVMATIQPVEEGSELQKMGYAMYGVIDFNNLNTKFTLTDENTITTSESDGFEFLTYGYNPQTKQSEQGIYKMKIIASGDTYQAIAKNISNQVNVAVIMKFPSKMQFEFSNKISGEWRTVMTSVVNTNIKKNDSSAFFTPNSDTFSFDGIITSNIDVESEEFGTVKDNSSYTFSLGQDPNKQEANFSMSFIQNDRNMIDLSMVFGNTAQIDISKIKQSENILEALMGLMQTVNVKDMSLTFMDDLTTKMAISNCAKLIQLNAEMSDARRHGASQSTIDSYVSQMNQLMSGNMYVKALDMTLPMQLQSAQVGIDYYAIPAVKFSDETTYVSLDQLLDRDAMGYLINVMDHGMAPTQDTMNILMQALYLMNSLTGNILNPAE